MLPQTSDVNWYNYAFVAVGPSPTVIDQLLPSIKCTYMDSTIEMLPVPGYMLLSSTENVNNEKGYYYSFLVYAIETYPFDMIVGASLLSRYIVQIDVEHSVVGFVAQPVDCYDYSRIISVYTQNATSTVSPTALAHSATTTAYNQRIPPLT